MSFSPKNVLEFYTAMMKNFLGRWNANFDYSIVDPTNPEELFDDVLYCRSSPIRTVYGSRIVIDVIISYEAKIY